MVCAPTDAPCDGSHHQHHFDVTHQILFFLKSELGVHDVRKGNGNQKAKQIGSALRPVKEIVEAAKRSPMDACINHTNGGIC